MNCKVEKHLAFRRVGEEMYIVDAKASRLHQLNGTAALIWEGLAAGKKEKAIAASIAAEFEVDEAAALADLREFAAVLEKHGLLTAAA